MRNHDQISPTWTRGGPRNRLPTGDQDAQIFGRSGEDVVRRMPAALGHLFGGQDPVASGPAEFACRQGLPPSVACFLAAGIVRGRFESKEAPRQTAGKGTVELGPGGFHESRFG